jgi:aspartate aminotransferase
VAVTPAKAFGADDHVRLSYAVDRKSIEEGLKRIAGFVSGLE